MESISSIVGLAVALGVTGLVIPTSMIIIAYCCQQRELDSLDDLEMAYVAPERSPESIKRAVTEQPTEPGNTGSPTASVTQTTTSSDHSTHSTVEAAVARLCKDPAIQRATIPLEEIHLSNVLNHGAYGEVYRGVYDGEPVAVKKLLPGRRHDMKEIATFLEEAKLMTSLRHRNIVRLVGVAWNTKAQLTKDALQDLSIVSELMEGGDLRSLLAHSSDANAPQGFHSESVRIAIDIARALTYLHNLEPSAVVHRDLKSKNVLLTRDLEAKLTDFGVSREQVQATMTAGVGSYLWMAPEIVYGRRYNGKADVFSFGVVLSELDTHDLPYSHAVDSETGRRMTEMAIVEMVSKGKLSVQFSTEADEEIVALARACVSHDPGLRPTAREALTKLEKCVDRLVRISTLSSGRGMTATLTTHMY